MKLEEYKGHDIELRDGVFCAYFEKEEITKGERLKDIKKKIDSLDRKKLRQPCLFQKWSSQELREGILTSVIEDDGRSGGYDYGKKYQVWVSFKSEPGDSPQRVKVDLNNAYPTTELNKANFKLIKNCRDQIKNLEHEIFGLKKGMVSFKSSDLGYKKEEGK